MSQSVKKDGWSRRSREKEVLPFGFCDKLGYMFGDFGNDFTFLFASSYLMIFYTKVLGISGFAVGILFLAARVVDAFTDVTMGRIVDNLRPAADGRFRPWLRRMCIPVAAASTLMYLYVVRELPYTGRLIYITVTYLLWSSFCYTAINIPYGSMASVISPDAGDRAALSTYRSVGASLASLVTGILVPLVVYSTDAEGNQLVIPERFTLVAAVFGVGAVICYMLCYCMCTERVAFKKSEAGRKDGIREVWQGLVKNRPLLALVCAALVLLLASLLGQTMNNYLFLDYFRNAKAMALANVITVASMLLLAPFISKIATTVGKKEAGAAGMLVAGVVYLFLFFVRVRSIPVFMVLLFLGSIGIGLFNMIVWAFITDIIDYQEVRTGKREDGTVYAVYSFARKVGQALAGGLGGFALTAIGYVSDAASQAAAVSERIYTVATLIPGVCYLIVFLIMQFWYPLTKTEVEKNTRLLGRKRADEAEDAGKTRG